MKASSCFGVLGTRRPNLENYPQLQVRYGSEALRAPLQIMFRAVVLGSGRNLLDISTVEQKAFRLSSCQRTQTHCSHVTVIETNPTLLGIQRSRCLFPSLFPSLSLCLCLCPYLWPLPQIAAVLCDPVRVAWLQL